MGNYTFVIICKYYSSDFCVNIWPTYWYYLAIKIFFKKFYSNNFEFIDESSSCCWFNCLLYVRLWRPSRRSSIALPPTAMIIAQIIIIFPIVTSLSHEIFDQNWREYKDQLRSINMTFFGVLFIISKHSYFLVITALLSAFGRAISEVGAVMIVGGNINHFTRVMTTAISLETRMGNLEYAMALGIVLILLTVLIYSLVYILNKRKI